MGVPVPVPVCPGSHPTKEPRSVVPRTELWLPRDNNQHTETRSVGWSMLPGVTYLPTGRERERERARTFVLRWINTWAYTCRTSLVFTLHPNPTINSVNWCDNHREGELPPNGRMELLLLFLDISDGFKWLLQDWAGLIARHTGQEPRTKKMFCRATVESKVVAGVTYTRFVNLKIAAAAGNTGLDFAVVSKRHCYSESYLHRVCVCVLGCNHSLIWVHLIKRAWELDDVAEEMPSRGNYTQQYGIVPRLSFPRMTKFYSSNGCLLKSLKKTKKNNNMSNLIVWEKISIRHIPPNRCNGLTFFQYFGCNSKKIGNSRIPGFFFKLKKNQFGLETQVWLWK